MRAEFTVKGVDAEALREAAWVEAERFFGAVRFHLRVVAARPAMWDVTGARGSRIQLWEGDAEAWPIEPDKAQ